MVGRQASLRLIGVVVAASLPALAGWRLAGPFGGSARAIAIDAQNRNTLLAGARDSLLFRSDDAGASWRLLAFPAGTPGTIDALIIDPTSSGHFYAGLDAGDSADSGVYESRDGGEHWQALAGMRGSRIESLAFAPSDPRVLAFDEPLGALDALTRISMQRLLERVWRDQAFTAILVTHDVAEAVALADRVLVIEDGRIAQDVNVDIPRPRRRGSADLAALEGSILRDLLRSGDEPSDL